MSGLPMMSAKMVFNLIGAGVFGKTESDSVDDFEEPLDFQSRLLHLLSPQFESGEFLNLSMISMGIPDVHPTLFELPKMVDSHSRRTAFCARRQCSGHGAKTGSIHEGEWLGAGLTHFLEHVLFNGTERRTSKQISDEIHGMGGYVNAYTSFDAQSSG